MSIKFCKKKKWSKKITINYKIKNLIPELIVVTEYEDKKGIVFEKFMT